MFRLVAELGRRNVVRVAAIYIGIAWATIHAGTILGETWDAPHWVMRLVTIFFVLGFPVVAAFAWVFELTPEGFKRTSEVDPHLSLTHRTARRLDIVIIALIIVVGAMLGGERFLVGPQVEQAGVAAARSASLNPGSAISVAVMPFANLSSDKEQEFFSDGMTEEITTALAKIPDLRVVARESAFQFKGEKKDVRAVGQALGATHLIEGSVRKVGDRVRIAAQLVKADDGVNVWANSYDREMTDVFAIQEDIARAIATSLRMPLGLKPGENLISNRTVDQQTYELYLKGVNALRTRSRQELDLLEQVVARDPNYAPGWAALTQARLEMRVYYERRGEDSKKGPLLEEAETSARKAIALAPDYAGGYAALAAVNSNRGKHQEAIDLFMQGLARDPDDPELLNAYSGMLWSLGYLKKALEQQEKVTLLEPLVPLYNRQRAQLLLTTGMTEAGVKELDLLNRQNVGSAGLFLAQIYAQQGRFAEAADQFDKTFASAPTDLFAGVFARPLVETAAQVLHAVANKSLPPAQLPNFYSELNFVYAYTNAPERMLDWPEKALKEGDYRPLRFTWWPMPSSLRKTERFKTLMRNAGHVDYWKARGWPDLCHPVGSNDFACD